MSACHTALKTVLAAPPAWEPLLQGSLRHRALEAGAAIAAELSSCEEPPPTTMADLYPSSLAHGDAGIALFLHYWNRVEPSGVVGQAVEHYLSRAIAGMAKSPMLSELYRGFSGIAWAVEHIRRQQGSAPDAESWKQIDAAVESWAGRESTPTELLEGLGGVLLFVAEHGRREGAERIFARTLDRLIEVARQKGRGRAWPVSARIQEDYEWHLTLSSRERFLLSDEWLKRGMTGYYKLSAAHGCIGTAGALASAIDAGFRAREAERLAGSAAEFVLEQELPPGAASIFPNAPGTILPKWTGGWCDGDAGMAAILCHIGRVLGRDDLHAHGLRVARLEARRRVEDVEAPNRDNFMFCHGSCGRAHIFNRLYQATGESQFAETALYWYEQALAVRKPGQGTGGFLVDEKREDGRLLNVRGLLMGAAGLGLALSAACHAIEPEWDRVFVLSGRSAR